MRYFNLKNSIAILTIIITAACEEVIDIDLNSSNPVLVAEGVIDNESPAWIRLSYTSDYFDTEQATIEENATVVISDNVGNSETLEYIADGLYQGSEMIGTSNKEYIITIQKDDGEFNATSKLYQPSEFISVTFEKNENIKPGQDETYVITIIFKDDLSVRNYYLFKFHTSGEAETNSYYLVDDYYYENAGEIEYSPLRINFELGDEVIIELYSIDEDAYIYYSELNDIGGGGMLGSSTPYNPKSNFGSEVLGYFTAWSRVEYITTVQ